VNQPVGVRWKNAKRWMFHLPVLLCIQCCLVKLFDFVPHSVSSAQLRQYTFLHLAGMIPSTYRITLFAEVSRLKNLACNEQFLEINQIMEQRIELSGVGVTPKTCILEVPFRILPTMPTIVYLMYSYLTTFSVSQIIQRRMKG
jgi:hypothetical protein